VQFSTQLSTVLRRSRVLICSSGFSIKSRAEQEDIAILSRVKERCEELRVEGRIVVRICRVKEVESCFASVFNVSSLVRVSSAMPIYRGISCITLFNSDLDSRSFWKLTSRFNSDSHSGSGVSGLRGGSSWYSNVSPDHNEINIVVDFIGPRMSNQVDDKISLKLHLTTSEPRSEMKVTLPRCESAFESRRASRPQSLRKLEKDQTHKMPEKYISPKQPVAFDVAVQCSAAH
jgi:hypothetical protein